MALTVSALADQAGLSPDTVRYHERVGLLPEPARSAAGYRLYDHTAVGRLRLIKGAQRAGLRLRENRRAAPGRRPRPVSLRAHRGPAAGAAGRGPRRARPPARPGGRPGRPAGAPARPGLPRHDRRCSRLVVRPGLCRSLPAIGREVIAMPLLDCPCTPDCPATTARPAAARPRRPVATRPVRRHRSRPTAILGYPAAMPGAPLLRRGLLTAARPLLPHDQPAGSGRADALPRTGRLAWVLAAAERPPLSGRGLRRPRPATGRGQEYGALGSRWVVAAGAEVQAHPATWRSSAARTH